MASLKRKTLYAVTIAVLLTMTTGCASMVRTGVRAGLAIGHPVMEDIETSIFQQQNLELAKAGLPGTIMLVEGLLETSPDDPLLLTLTAKAYIALGFMIEDESPAQATALYSRATECGIAALKHHRRFRNALKDGSSVAEAAKTVKSKKFLPALMWTATGMGANVLLNVGDPMIAVDLGNVDALVKQVNQIDSNYFYGFAHMFMGITNSMLPAAFGGDKDRAKKEFETVFKMNDGKFLLPTFFFVKFYLTDEDTQLKTLRKVIDAPDGLMPDIALMNQIAKAKARYYLKEKGELVDE
ncbi:MAG: TRAP transporter TatT component family protein [Thermodesulfobacteriota bacterium]|nr:TRAP transporter TatT component family protein [Thermodesulfobacteriota bacterium]